MLGEQRVIAFVATTQPDAAEQFYRDTLGLTQTSRDPFALVFDAGGTLLRVASVDSFRPQPFTALGWIVADIESTVRGLVERGVVFTRYEGMDQDGLGIWQAPEGARIAWFTDPDGNTLSLTQF